MPPPSSSKPSLGVGGARRDEGAGPPRAASVGLREFSTRAPEPPRRRPPLRTGGPRDGDSPGAASRARGGEATGRGASEEKRRRKRRRGGPWRCGGPAARRGEGGGAGRATLASACDGEARRRSDGDGTTGPRLRGGKGRAGLRVPAERAPPRTSQCGARRRPRGTRPRVSRVRPRPDPRAPAGPRALVCAREAALGARARPCSRFHMSPPWTLGRRRPGGFLCPPAVLSSRGAGTPAPALPYRSAPNCFISSCAEENMGLTLERVRIGDPTVLRHLRTTDWPVCYLQDLLFLRMSIFWSIGFQDKHIPANMIPGQAVLEFELATEKGLSPGHTHSFQWGVSHSWLC
eukprot:XP_005637479.1 serine/arginine repetitive matrix protein 3-like [Canis lupus familiaris]